MKRRMPDLPPQCLQPAGMRWGTYAAKDGAELRWGLLSAPYPTTRCVLVGGFSECAEKYYETLVDLAERGLAVWFLEWRGQGESTRPRSYPNRPRARDFERDADDLASFTAAIVGEGKPAVVIGHSMGATIALLAMRRRPKLFDAAILSSPMLALRTAGIPWSLARGVAAVAVALRLGHSVVPGSRTWPVEAALVPERSRTSSDAIRCRVQASWFAERPQLRIDGVTFAWLASALDLCRRLEDGEMFAAMATPVLMGSAGFDYFVDQDAHRHTAAILPDCRYAVFADAKHDLFMEADPIRNRWLAEIDHFLGDLRATCQRTQEVAAAVAQR